MPESLPIESVNHIARVVRDLEASRRFYRDVLGFREVWRPNFPFRGAWLCNYGMQIHLIVPDSTPCAADSDARDANILTRADHLALHVADTSRIGELLDQHGIPYRTNYVADTGVTQYFFHDPDGNHIEIGTYPPVRER